MTLYDLCQIGAYTKQGSTRPRPRRCHTLFYMRIKADGNQLSYLLPETKTSAQADQSMLYRPGTHARTLERTGRKHRSCTHTMVQTGSSWYSISWTPGCTLCEFINAAQVVCRHWPADSPTSLIPRVQTFPYRVRYIGLNSDIYVSEDQKRRFSLELGLVPFSHPFLSLPFRLSLSLTNLPSS